MKRAEFLPLQTIINHTLYRDHETFVPQPVSFACAFAVDMWIPGKPKAKPRAVPMVGRGGFAFMHTDPKEKLAADYIREVFMETMDRLYADRVQHLPLVKEHGVADIDIYALMPPPKHFFSGMPHQGAPDADNITKLVKDALSGRAAGRPPLAFKDDSLVRRSGPTTKVYWDPSLVDAPGYPTSPGTYVRIHYYPYPRNPAWLDRVCKGCGKDDFTSEKQIVPHTKKCLAVQLAKQLAEQGQ